MLTSDFIEFAQLRRTNGVEYLMVGGYALAAHGHPSYTGDLAFWVDTDPLNAEKIIKTLNDFGVSSANLTAKDFTAPNQTVQLGYPPRRIDLLTGISGVDFRQCCERRLIVAVDGVDLSSISLGDFKINKAAVGRPTDLADPADPANLDSLR